jgi:hypothetical protein
MELYHLHSHLKIDLGQTTFSLGKPHCLVLGIAYSRIMSNQQEGGNGIQPVEEVDGGAGQQMT